MLNWVRMDTQKPHCRTRQSRGGDGKEKQDRQGEGERAKMGQGGEREKSHIPPKPKNEDREALGIPKKDDRDELCFWWSPPPKMEAAMLGALWRLRERDDEFERERCLLLLPCFLLPWWDEWRREWDERAEMTLPVSKSKKPIVAQVIFF